MSTSIDQIKTTLEKALRTLLYLFQQDEAVRTIRSG